MIGKSQKTLFGVLVLVLTVALFGAVSLTAQAPGLQPSGEVFENVQVLTTLPAHLMQQTMQ